MQGTPTLALTRMASATSSRGACRTASQLGKRCFRVANARPLVLSVVFWLRSVRTWGREEDGGCVARACGITEQTSLPSRAVPICQVQQHGEGPRHSTPASVQQDGQPARTSAGQLCFHRLTRLSSTVRRSSQPTAGSPCCLFRCGQPCAAASRSATARHASAVGAGQAG